MTKKNLDGLDGLRTYDGPSQSTKNLVNLSGIPFTYPSMSIRTHYQLLKSMRDSLRAMHGGSKMADLLDDSVALIDALQIKFDLMPVAEVMNATLNEAHDDYEEKAANAHKQEN